MHAVLAALKKNSSRIDAVWVYTGRDDKRTEAVIQMARACGVKVHPSPSEKLDRLASGVRHQGVVARLRAVPVRTEQDLAGFLSDLPDTALLLVLDGVQDPHNLGACLRSADAVGAHAVIIPRDQTAPVTAVTRRAASGAAETVPLFRVTNLARCLRRLKEAGIWILGASQGADTALFDVDMRGPLAIVLGGEGKGLRRLTRERCDRLARIPMAGSVESLNVSVAAGVCLFEAVRQRYVASSK
ncbi:MAG: 23S rRNA (guanosine(2251)-2'-O)-methyltransferase RlmB [Gammaproteobacteria bacterium]|nr:MAG: 23S rRNA (guanosine(2251)-2'-O)-methyltransferase RlmB [Gammaproteobacteria bacterium]